MINIFYKNCGFNKDCFIAVCTGCKFLECMIYLLVDGIFLEQQVYPNTLYEKRIILLFLCEF
jgi:hypothetical protein